MPTAPRVFVFTEQEQHKDSRELANGHATYEP